MSNSITNAKLPIGDNQNRDNQTTANNSNPTTRATVSAGQGREIFSQVNVNLGANLNNSDITRRKEKPANNNDSEGEKTDWKSIKQGTDSSKTSRIQGTDSAKTAKNQLGKNAKTGNSNNPQPKKQTPGSDAVKSNNARPAVKSNNEKNDSAAPNNSQIAAQNDENRSAKSNNSNSNNQPRTENPNFEKGNENRNSTSRNNDGENRAKPNSETNRPNAEFNARADANQTQTNEKQDAANNSTNNLNRGQQYDRTGQERGKPEENNRIAANNSQNNSPKSSPNNRNSPPSFKNGDENTALFDNRSQSVGSNRFAGNQAQTRHLDLTINLFDSNNSEHASNSPDIRQNGLLGEVISRVFRESDVYLSRNAVNNLVERHGANVLNRSSNSAFEHLPKEISQLVEAIENQILQNSDSRQIDNKHISNRVSIELPPELDNKIQTAKNLFTQIFGASDAKHFAQMNIRERMLAAIEIFLRNLPAEMPGNLQNKSAEKILAGFLLARGFVCSDSRNQTENLLGMMQSAASEKVSLASMRDFGGLVKVLISDAAAAKSTANLNTAVEKFARILIAINCLDTILTAVKLAGQSRFAGGNVGRTLAIAQVYELINRLVLAGQNAMREAAELAQKNAAFKVESDKNSRSIFPAKTVADLTETDANDRKNGDSKNVQAESALRKFLEFNPLLAADKFISAFENSDDARQAQNDFLNHHQIEIEQWLRGGNHRLVKDVAFEKPIGIVVERDAKDFFSATTARIVLVRDGSVQGWHFLKSFLVA